MSYCVHCGVKLASYETKCPLCGTEVIDPSGNQEVNVPRFEDIIDTSDKKVNRHFLFVLISIIALIPVIITGIINFAIDRTFTWSLLVVGAELTVWVWVMIPFRYSFKNPLIYLFLDLLAIIFYVFLISLMFQGSTWYFKLALPLILVTGLMIILMYYLFIQKQFNKIRIAGLFLIILAVYLFFIDMLITHFITDSFDVTWAHWPAVPMLIIGLILVFISLSNRLSDWMRKKLFI